MFRYEVLIKTDPHSENYLYHPRIGHTKSGKQYTFLYKDPLIVEYAGMIKKAVEDRIEGLDVPPPDLVKKIVTCFVFGIPNNRFYKRDLTNFIKAAEDGAFSALEGFDDSQVVASSQLKIGLREDETPFLYFQIRMLTRDDELVVQNLVEMPLHWEGKVDGIFSEVYY